MDKVEILIFIMAILIFLFVLLALITLEIFGHGVASGDREVLRGVSGQAFVVALPRNLNLRTDLDVTE